MIVNKIKRVFEAIRGRPQYDPNFGICTDITSLPIANCDEVVNIEKLLQSPNREVYVQESKVAKDPLYSRRYANCNGVVLLSSNGEMGFMHAAYPNNIRQEFLPELIDKNKLVNLLGLRAVIIGGEPTHFWDNVETLRQRKIPIVASFLDSWGHFEDSHGPRDNGTKRYFKDLVAFPETKEVFIMARGGRSECAYGDNVWRKLL